MAKAFVGALGLGSSKPPRVRFSGHGVALVDPALSNKTSAQPTNQDVLNAIQDLSKKLNQLSKNQQALEAQMTSILKSTSDIDGNVITGAQYLMTCLVNATWPEMCPWPKPPKWA